MGQSYGDKLGNLHARWWIQTSLLVFTDTPNVAWIVSVIWQDLLRRADLYRLFKYRGGCAIPLFELSVWCEKCVAARHYAVICKQLLKANDINRFRQVVLDLLQDGACTDFFENISENSLKGTYRMLPLSAHLFSHWSITLMFILTPPPIPHLDSRYSSMYNVHCTMYIVPVYPRGVCAFNLAKPAEQSNCDDFSFV